MKNIFLLLAGLFSGASCADSKPSYTTVDNAAFAAVISREGVQLIDVRTSGEFAEGHLPEAVNIDVNSADFETRIAQLDTMRPVAVYCRSGARSRMAARQLAAQGFEVYNLNDGIIGWDGAVSR